MRNAKSIFINLAEITPVILTLNEEANIGRCLSCLEWASRIVVVDSGSSDGTERLVSGIDSAELISREFDSYAQQWNFGLSRVETKWALSLDANYILSGDWIREVQALDPTDIAAFVCPFTYQIYGHSLRNSLYPPRPVLFRPSQCEYWDDGHAQSLNVAGKTSQLRSHIFHDDRKSLSNWFRAQQRYSHLEAEKLLSKNQHNLDWADRMRRLGWPAVLATPLYCLLVKGLLLEGWPGWFYTLQRTLAEMLLSLQILERRLKPAGRDSLRN